MNRTQLSLVNAPYIERDTTGSVYTKAFEKSKRGRDSFIAKVRGTIYGFVRKVRGI